MIKHWSHPETGLGIDIESSSRFDNLDRTTDTLFLDTIFTASELDYCFASVDPAPHLAVRFAAKEATIKALGSLGLGKVSLPYIEITLEQSGAPVLSVRNVTGLQTHVSLSHHATVAVAVVILYKY